MAVLPTAPNSGCRRHLEADAHPIAEACAHRPVARVIGRTGIGGRCFSGRSVGLPEPFPGAFHLLQRASGPEPLVRWMWALVSRTTWHLPTTPNPPTFLPFLPFSPFPVLFPSPLGQTFHRCGRCDKCCFVCALLCAWLPSPLVAREVRPLVMTTLPLWVRCVRLFPPAPAFRCTPLIVAPTTPSPLPSHPHTCQNTVQRCLAAATSSPMRRWFPSSGASSPRGTPSLSRCRGTHPRPPCVVAHPNHHALP